MGKPSQTPPTPPADAISLHTQPDTNYFDDDAPHVQLRADDLPPLYSDHDEASGSASAPLLPPQGPPAPTLLAGPQNVNGLALPYSRNDTTGAERYIEPRLSCDPQTLETQVRHWAALPPRQTVRVYGWHMTSINNNGKQERRRVTDFDICADLTPYLYRDAPARKSWRSLRTVQNAELARRGTVFQTRGPPVKASSLEAGGHTAEEDATVQEWCHRFCASSAGLRCFRLERRVVGMDTARLQGLLMNVRQSTNYRGHLEISFPVRDATVDVYNAARINEWRFSKWVRFFCYLTFLWLFTWPYLFFRTKRYEVIVADWPFSRLGQDGQTEYVSFSEDQWYGLWGRVIHNAVLEKRQGTIEPQEIEALDRSGPPAFNTGHAGTDSVLGFVAASVAAIGEVNRASGWGHDTA